MSNNLNTDNVVINSEAEMIGDNSIRENIKIDYANSQSLSESENSIIEIDIDNYLLHFQPKTNEKTLWEKICYQVEKFLESKVFNIIFAIAILINLFLEDIRIFVIPDDYDFQIEVVKLILFLFFVLEMCLSFIFIKSYRFSFFFYFDIVAICGLIPEAHLLYESHHQDYIYEDKNL